MSLKQGDQQFESQEEPKKSPPLTPKQQALELLLFIEKKRNRKHTKLGQVSAKFLPLLEIYKEQFVIARREYNLARNEGLVGEKLYQMPYQKVIEGLLDRAEQKGCEYESQDFYDEYDTLEQELLDNLVRAPSPDDFKKGFSEILENKLEGFDFLKDAGFLVGVICGDGKTYAQLVNDLRGDLQEAEKEYKAATNLYQFARNELAEQKELAQESLVFAEPMAENPSKKEASKVEGAALPADNDINQPLLTEASIPTVSYAKDKSKGKALVVAEEDQGVVAAEEKLQEKKLVFTKVVSDISELLAKGKDATDSEDGFASKATQALGKYIAAAKGVGAAKKGVAEAKADRQSFRGNREKLMKPANSCRDAAIAIAVLGVAGAAVLTPILLGAIAFPPAGIAVLAALVATLVVVSVACAIAASVKASKGKQKARTFGQGLLSAKQVPPVEEGTSLLELAAGNQIESQDLDLHAYSNDGGKPQNGLV